MEKEDTPIIQGQTRRGLGASASKGHRDETSFWNDMAPSIIAFAQGAQALSKLATVYMLKDDFGFSPAWCSALQGIISVPWVVKPLWALCSDCYPIMGYRRKSYLMICAITHIFSLFTLAAIGYRMPFVACTCLFLDSTCLSILNVIAEALVVETGRKQGVSSATNTVTSFFGLKNLGFLIFAWVGGWILEFVSKSTVFAICALFPLASFSCAMAMKEDQVFVRPDLRKQMQLLANTLSTPVIFNTCIVIFALQAMPSYSMAMFFFFTNELGFTEEFMGRLAMIGSAAGIAGIYIYRRWLSDVPIRSLVFWAKLCSVPFMLLPIVLVQRWNRAWGISDQWFAVGDDVIIDVVGKFQIMPILVIAAQLCPIGLECSVYSAIIACINFGGCLAPMLAAVLMTFFNVKLEKSEPHYEHLAHYMICCSLLSCVPLLLVKMLPSKNQLRNHQSMVNDTKFYGVNEDNEKILAQI